MHEENRQNSEQKDRISNRIKKVREYPKDCVNLCTNVRLTYEYGGFLWPDEDQIHRKRLLSEK